MGARWDGPPPEEAYGRVTEPGRFAALHAIGRDLLDELESRFDVDREDSSEPDHHNTAPAPAVRLVPADRAAAALTLVFDAFPGIGVRIGRDVMHLPACGCDACDETVDECAEQLCEHIDALTAGSFGERLVHEHGWWHERWYRTANGTRKSRTRVGGDALAELRAALPDGELRWAPWRRRHT